MKGYLNGKVVRGKRERCNILGEPKVNVLKKLRLFIFSQNLSGFLVRWVFLDRM